MTKFTQDGIKAQVKRTRKNLHLQSGDSIELAKADKEFFFYKTEKDLIFFGEATEAYSYTDVKARDMRKPVRRESLSISPRLAKILINLTQSQPGQLLLDPFCGIGAILQEAMAKGINVYGVDKDPLAIANAQRNLKWFSKEYEVEGTFRLMNEDSSKIKNITPDAIATESPLGEVVRRKLTNHAAEEYVRKFERAIIPVLRNLKNIKKPYAKIAMTIPFVRESFINMEYLCRQTGLRICKIADDINFPIKEYREDQFVSREIVVLE
jgi:tRNA G10  N-methylase Trm11